MQASPSKNFLSAESSHRTKHPHPPDVAKLMYEDRALLHAHLSGFRAFLRALVNLAWLCLAFLSLLCVVVLLVYSYHK